MHDSTPPPPPERDTLPILPCPECRRSGHGGNARIGNRRNSCTVCNNFAQNVMRLTRKRLMETYKEEYAMMRYRVELNLYPQVIEDFAARHPQTQLHGKEMGL